MRATVATDRIGSIGFIVFVCLLLIIFACASFGPPPPNTDAIAWSGVGQWLIILCAVWVDRHRDMKG